MTTSTGTGIFDGHHPPSRELADDCVHCGFCLPACPTYALWRREADSPRGRIYLMKAGLDGRAPLDAAYQRHFDTCLGCMACMTTCPSGVQYDRLIEATRPQLERHGRRSLADRVFRSLIFSLFPHPPRLRALTWPLALYQKSGARRLLRLSGLLRLMPQRLAAMESLLPEVSIARDDVPERVAAVGEPRRRVGLLLGCVQRVFFGHVNAATARVLAAEGCDVLAPADQGCCGALALHAGRDAEAAACARAIIDAFEHVDADQIVINAAGCGSAMKTYGELLGDDPVYADRARAFAQKCVDVSELLADLEPRAPRHPVDVTVAYHDACHLQHAQRVKAAPRRVLQAIPGMELREISESDLCCGSAGIYNMLEPDAAAALRDRKVQNVLKTGADVVVSGNPGCMMQIAAGLGAARRSVRSRHLIEIVDASIRNAPLG
ncbi:MAG TPA: heterodisulfide reductase-related iron-sulfur binding cluster [Vicinamibacterales bacterium]|nr:heterodisulfide reductase-related iron-sulfur binding cluster [Vicinamibacterales bacterium]